MDDFSDIEQAVKHPPVSYASTSVARTVHAVDAAIPEWRRWSPEMRAIFASLHIADTYENVGKLLKIDT